VADNCDVSTFDLSGRFFSVSRRKSYTRRLKRDEQ